MLRDISIKKLLQTFLSALLYGLLFHALQFWLFRMGITKMAPTAESLLHWDANWYHNIVKDGYWYIERFNSNSGFFVLLPWIWKALHVGVWGISFVNTVFFAIGFTILTSLTRARTADAFLWLTIPSLYFCFIPYTEALFILVMSIVLYAVQNNRKYILWVALFLASLVRPVSMVMIPAFLIMELLTNQRRLCVKSMGRFAVHYAVPMLVGLAFFVWYQHHETGIWFAYFKQQARVWGHQFAWPTLPLNSMYGLRLLWLNALALFIGFISLVLIMQKGMAWLYRNRVVENKLTLVSYLYLCGMSFVTILFNPTWTVDTTNVYDIHRYAFASPFFLIFLHHHTTSRNYSLRDIVGLIALSNIFWLLLFASYSSLEYFLYFNFSTALIVLYMLYANKRALWQTVLVASLNIYIQINMFQSFLQNEYPG